jgi:hypothetical protein
MSAVTATATATTTMPEPSEFMRMPVERREAIYAEAKKAARMTRRRYKTHWRNSRWMKEEVEETKDFIYRGFKVLPEGWGMYKRYMEKEYPEGERLEMENGEEQNLENYSKLYSWIRGDCHKCGSEQVWWEGDKHVEYLCLGCGEETPFVRGVWGYY